MLFWLLKFYARLALKVSCRSVVMNKPQYLNFPGPVLFAANHPNSFLDGVLLTTLRKQRLWSLARGDAFKNKKVRPLLHWLHLLPVYRTSEGVQNLQHNYSTFEACLEVFKQNDAVMIFSEGRCINEWRLRPLKKGTARLAISAWQQGIPLQVIPVGLNYSPFRNFGKNVFINFGEPLLQDVVLNETGDGKQLAAFNNQLQQQLQSLVYKIDPKDEKLISEKLCVHQPLLKQMVLAPLAFAGWMLHAPFYYSLKATTQTYFNNDHFDSVVACMGMLAYPLYLLLLCTLTWIVFNGTAALILAVLLPLTAWACVQLKPQIS